jgi:SAM-dependent methyltransferase
MNDSQRRDMGPERPEHEKADQSLRTRIEIHRLHTIGQPLEPAIDKALNLQTGEDLLDIGTGPGDFPARLRQSGHRGRIVGIDVSPEMLAKARSADADVEFLQAGAQALPFPDESFNAVTARHVLYQVPDIPRALRQAHRVLRPGGRFLVVANVHDNFADYRKALHEAAELIYGRPMADTMRVIVPACDVFNEQNGPSMIKNVFGNVQTTFVEAALRFETAEPALRYYDATRTLQGPNPHQGDPLRQAFAQIVARRLTSGPWLIPKSVVLLIGIKTPLKTGQL